MKRSCKRNYFVCYKSLSGKRGECPDPILHSAGHPVHGTLATLISLITLFIVSMGMFSELQDALNFIWWIPGHRRSSALWECLEPGSSRFCWSSGNSIPSFHYLSPEHPDGCSSQIHSQGDARTPSHYDGDQYHGTSGCNGCRKELGRMSGLEQLALPPYLHWESGQSRCIWEGRR
jgi:hypothetical protein